MSSPGPKIIGPKNVYPSLALGLLKKLKALPFQAFTGSGQVRYPRRKTELIDLVGVCVQRVPYQAKKSVSHMLTLHMHYLHLHPSHI